MKINLRMYSILLLIPLLCCQAAAVYAQQVVTGTVRSADDNTPLPGVNVLVKGTTAGTTTDALGNFSIDVGPDAILQFSFIGYLTQEIAVGNQTSINVVIEPDARQLEEVVVIGYTSESKRDLASSVSTLSSEEITGLATSDIRQTLQGKMAGVQVVSNNGTPGAGARVIVRGVGSFSNPDPLYVIDGIQGGDINTIQPQDIESITVLKDAATTAIYGSAAANGVVIITTKNGKKGKPVVAYDGSFGFSEVTRRYDMLNASEYVDLVEDIQAAGGLDITDKLRSAEVRQDRTDWQDAIFRKGAFSQHNLNLSGGSENVSYAVSAGYTNQESTIIDRDFKRATFGAKLQETIGRFTLTQNLRLKYDQNNGTLAGFGDALRMPPYLGIYDPANLGGFSRSDKTEDLNDSNNPYNSVYNSDYESRDLNMNLDLSAEVSILKSLSFKSQGRISAGNNNNFTFNRPSNGGNFVKLAADMSEFYSRYYHYIIENFLVFDQDFGNHSLNAVLGNSYNAATLSRDVTVGGSDFTNDNIQNIRLANTRSVTGANVNSGKARISYFARVGYTFNNRYLLNVSFRRDASSVFGENYQRGYFPGVGVGWNISEEEFMQGVPQISTLKLRASYGVSGNDNIGGFLTTSTVFRGWSNNLVYSFGNGQDFTTGSTVTRLPNQNLKWEETTQKDIGLEVGLMDDKLNFTFDYYTRDNEDLLIQTEIPRSTGLGEGSYAATQWVNAASMKNTGFEMAVSYGASSSSGFTYNISLNASHNVNEVTALGTINDTPLNNGQWVDGVGNATRTDIGHPLGSFYGYVVDRVAVDQADVNRLNENASAVTGGEKTEYAPGLKPGDFVFRDIDGNGFIDDEDRTYIGNPAPKWQYGGSVSLGYKGIDLELNFMGLADVEIVNGLRYYVEGMSKPFNQTSATLRRWQNEGDVTDIPAAGQNSGRNLAFSTWYVEDGSYFRMRNITLGYKLPSSLLNSLTNNVVKSFRIYLSGQNLFTVTDYSGYDPEISAIGTTEAEFIFGRGIDNYQLPNPKTYRAGLQITF